MQGDTGLSPGSGRSPGEGNDNPLQYSCLGNPIDRGAWRATVYGVAASDTTEKLKNSNKHSPEYISRLQDMDRERYKESLWF